MPKHNLIKQSFPFTTDPLKVLHFAECFPSYLAIFLKARVAETRDIFFSNESIKTLTF